jgi:hypothetical protein
LLEARKAVIASMDDMDRQARNDQPRSSPHATPTESRSLG